LNVEDFDIALALATGLAGGVEGVWSWSGIGIRAGTTGNVVKIRVQVSVSATIRGAAAMVVVLRRRLKSCHPGDEASVK
jgi:hypothetical protein